MLNVLKEMNPGMQYAKIRRSTMLTYLKMRSVEVGAAAYWLDM